MSAFFKLLEVFENDAPLGTIINLKTSHGETRFELLQATKKEVQSLVDMLNCEMLEASDYKAKSDFLESKIQILTDLCTDCFNELRMLRGLLDETNCRIGIDESLMGRLVAQLPDYIRKEAEIND